jgi:formylglycine-generating enzyme required for sulfatase activity
MLRAIVLATLALLATTACSRHSDEATANAASKQAQTPVVTISADQAVSPVPAWVAPAIEVTDATANAMKVKAAAALKAGHLFENADAAIPIYLALRVHDPDDASISEGFAASLRALLVQGDAALEAIDDDPLSLRRAHEVGAAARAIAPDDVAVVAYLDRLERIDLAQQANRLGEEELNAGRIGEAGSDGAIKRFRQALQLRPGDARAAQGLAAAESELIRRAETAAQADDYAGAESWLQHAQGVRPGIDTVDKARVRLAAQRASRLGELRDRGIRALSQKDGINEARGHLAALLRIAPSGDPAAAELRQRIDLAVHYGLFRPGQVFTDALDTGGRGPQLVVIPHGAFRMGAPSGEADSTEVERPQRNVRFERGLAMSRTEVTVGEFRRFIAATRHRARAVRRGYSTAYDERSGNLVRRGGIDWSSDYAGRPARDDLPVVHVSVKDATAYAQWLSERSGQRYRLPSEAEFEYALRAGSQTRYPWGDASPPDRSGNYTGGLDVSPSGRRWQNAFPGYGDDSWGPATVGSYLPNRYGLHDLAGNVSEWVADCWHESYRRAPADGSAWVNPGCRIRVMRGGSWASSPAQTRSAWRLGNGADNTSARTGFRVVREI